MNHIAVIENTFFRLEINQDATQTLTVSKPGRIEDTVYMPPESITLTGDIIYELRKFIHDALKVYHNDTDKPNTETAAEPRGDCTEVEHDSSGEDISGTVSEIQGTELRHPTDTGDNEAVYL